MDLSVNERGALDLSALMTNVEAVLASPDTVFEHFTDFSGYSVKITFLVMFALGIYALMKYSSKKRLHRKGVEHGSARWANAKEEQFLRDNEDKKRHKYDWLNKLPSFVQNPLRKLLKAPPPEIVPFQTDNNILLTQEVRMSLNTRQHRENLNVLVIGGSGSGKSRFYVKPNLMQLNTSYVVTDPKGELLRSCGKLLKKAGYEIRVFNLIDMAHSNNYNPFDYVYDRDGNVNKSYVLKMINCLMKNTKQEGSSGGDQFWDDSTKALTLAISFYLLEKAELETRNEKGDYEHQLAVYDEMLKGNYAPEDIELQSEIVKDAEKAYEEADKHAKIDCNFRRVMEVMKMAEISEQDDTLQSPLDDLMEEHRANFPNSMAWIYYADFKKAPAETAKSILISAAVRFAAFELPEVADLTHIDNIHLDTMGDKKTALFVIIPSSDATFNFLAAMMYTQLFDTLYDTANFKYGGRLPVHVRCLLDEFANIGTIPDFDKLLATMRSMEISANIIIQNLAQLKKMYDKSWEIVTGNCDSLLFLGGQEASTLEAISKSLGKETIDVVSQNRTRSHKSPSTSENNSILGRELMTPDELKVMKPNECVLIVRALYPFYCHKFDIEKHVNYAYLEDSNKKYAYLIDDLHTEKAPDMTENYSEMTTSEDDSQPADKEKPFTDLDFPDDPDDDDMDMEEYGMVNNSIDNEFVSASERIYGLSEEMDFSDEELPNADNIISLDMSERKILGDADFNAMMDSSDLF
ncbi:MAG: type IV secretory system conjugative DNA transfer family protein [Ruminococcaceae bacterium]|nr:type IV secretory system conjugative DNA transfer family protein [Oscillospiraceae bacterium]